MPDFSDIDYLREGNPIQQKCYSVLVSTGIMDLLKPYGPIVAGTIPIGIDIPGSDIDILCSAADLGDLENILSNHFGEYKGFQCRELNQNGRSSLVCSFTAEGMEIEVFAQDIPAVEQNGYRHMITEYELLCVYGEELRSKIISLKLAGMKTEPAFAYALGLEGDPYEAILEKGRKLKLF